MDETQSLRMLREVYAEKGREGLLPVNLPGDLLQAMATRAGLDERERRNVVAASISLFMYGHMRVMEHANNQLFHGAYLPYLMNVLLAHMDKHNVFYGVLHPTCDNVFDINRIAIRYKDLEVSLTEAISEPPKKVKREVSEPSGPVPGEGFSLHHYVEPIIDEYDFNPVEYTSQEKIRKLTSHRFEGYFFPLDKIRIEPGYNARIPTVRRDAHIRWIADQIRDHGFDQGKPLTGFVNREGFFVVTDGHCRYEATLLAKSEGAQINALPCLPESKSFTDEDRALALFRRNEGKALEPVEVAIVVKRLERFNWTIQKIAEHINKSSTYVENMLTLAGAPIQVRDMVINGKISASLAIDTLKKEGTVSTITTLNAAIEDAEVRGKKATAKTVAKVSQHSNPAINWRRVGPKLQKALQSVVDATDDVSLRARIAESQALLHELKGSELISEAA